MDYAEEQAQELEALEAILMDDLQGRIPAQPTHMSSHCRAEHLAPASPPHPGRKPVPPRVRDLSGAYSHTEFDGTRPDGWDPSCACYSVAISPADDGAVSPAADDAAACATPSFQPR